MLTVVLAVLGGGLAGLLAPSVVEQIPAGQLPRLRDATPSGRRSEWLLIAAVAATCGVLAGSVGPTAELPAFFYLGWVGVVLAAIDLRHHRLPDLLVLPSYPIAVALLSVAATADGDGGPLARSLACAAALAGFYYVIAFAAPGGLGFGDVKLAGVLGLYLGWVGWSAVVLAIVLAFTSAAAMALILIALRRAGRRSRIPFGPFMIVGALASVVAM